MDLTELRKVTAQEESQSNRSKVRCRDEGESLPRFNIPSRPTERTGIATPASEENELRVALQERELNSRREHNDRQRADDIIRDAQADCLIYYLKSTGGAELLRVRAIIIIQYPCTFLRRYSFRRIPALLVVQIDPCCCRTVESAPACIYHEVHRPLHS